ncbi:nucleoside-diphosphate sugar epimerase/dehydratase [Saccharibacillus sp. CPCC 101409]|uniref:polysaccharide biosynthesis protein n=1 Tax=Saccharibacillus sp. CPCC 101409 TaxID=3058041 RepID=UPI002673F802|nr:nucleoside-diphosphate sugar epimerase/dehydratase [Saccharibacillus sp. CPCC 101409]MDO3412023.1 nucleoside-diphosphate sugar epimerase/dehydratase [Saccharibacillus sp. CPCC 101409]
MIRNRYFVPLLLFDGAAMALAVLLAYALRFDGNIPPEYAKAIKYVVPVYEILFFSLFIHHKVYKKSWRYAEIKDIFGLIEYLFLAGGLAYIVFSGAGYINPSFVVPRSIPIMVVPFSIIGILSARFLMNRAEGSRNKIHPGQRKALIFGAGDAGTLIVKELGRSKVETSFYPVAFIDDARRKHNMEIMGLPVLGGRQDIPGIVQRLNIQTIILALPVVSERDMREIVDICRLTGCTLKTVPRMIDLIHGTAGVNAIRDVSVEDLLGRDPVQMDSNAIRRTVTGKTVLVTGAGGSIGSELSRQLCGFQPERLILLGRGENSIYTIQQELKRKFEDVAVEAVIVNIQDRKGLEAVFARCLPEVVFHAAAHKHVPLMEANPIEAIKNNIFGTRNVAECADHYRAAHFVLVSTDKAVNPGSVMGATKKAAESIVYRLQKHSGTVFASVRFGNVLGSRGSVVPIFKDQIARGGPVTVTHPDMVRYFMTIPEAVQLVIQACAFAEGGELFILDMGKPVRIADLARDLITLSGLEPEKDIEIRFTGIRPGEKLYEEILSPEEGAAATKHDKIYISRAAEIQDSAFEENLDLLRILCESDQNERMTQTVRELLHKLVPTYCMPSIREIGIETEISRQENSIALQPHRT